jgi:hypothetical protein
MLELFFHNLLITSNRRVYFSHNSLMTATTQTHQGRLYIAAYRLIVSTYIEYDQFPHYCTTIFILSSPAHMMFLHQYQYIRCSIFLRSIPPWCMCVYIMYILDNSGWGIQPEGACESISTRALALRYAPIEPLLLMFPPDALRCALNDSVASGVFIDTKCYLFSCRNSSGKVCRPRPLYANSLTLKSVSYFEDREHVISPRHTRR